jgi:predicted membrane protein
MKDFLNNNWYKILAIIILLLALGSWSYGYYQFLRWAIFAIGIYGAYIIYQQNKGVWTWVFAAIAILFNPILPFYLSKSNWQVIDVIAAIMFFVSLFQKHEGKKLK